MKKINQQEGFLELIVIVLIALILLRFLGVDISSVLNNSWIKDFISYTKELLLLVWEDIKTIFNFFIKK